MRIRLGLTSQFLLKHHVACAQNRGRYVSHQSRFEVSTRNADRVSWNELMKFNSQVSVAYEIDLTKNFEDFRLDQRNQEL